MHHDEIVRILAWSAEHGLGINTNKLFEQCPHFECRNLSSNALSGENFAFKHCIWVVFHFQVCIAKHIERKISQDQRIEEYY